MKNNLEKVLIHLADLFNKHHITWGLGGSLLLKYEGFNCDVNDIDIIVDILDYQKLVEVIKDIPYVYMNSNEKYQTEHFFTLTLMDIDIDIMLNFAVRHKKGTYHFPFNKSLIPKTLKLNGVDIHLTDVNEWKKAYNYMNREDKIKLLDGKK